MSPAMKPTALSLALLSSLLSSAGFAQMGDPLKVSLKTTKVAGGISVIEGADGFAGGNVAASVGDDGLFIVDDELQPLTPKLQAALAALTRKPVRFVINTHWHGDHTGGNGGLAAAGAIIVAQDNVRKRLSVDQVLNQFGRKMTFAPAHTDGDAIVHFKKANVIHAGDVFTGSYPIVDTDSGGVYEGFIAAADRLLALADDSTKIIPGHGPVMGRADLVAWREMLIQIRDRIGKLVAQHKTLDEIKAAKPTADFDARWGQGFIKAEMLVESVYRSKPAKPDKAPGTPKLHAK